MKGGAECRVRGPLGWALRVSQLAGAAPLRLRALRPRPGWRVLASPAFDLFSKATSVTWCFLTAAALLMDLYVAPERSLRSRTVSSVIVYATDVTVMSALMLAASFTGARRMSCLIGCLARLQKINSELKVHRRSRSAGAGAAGAVSDRNQWLILTGSLAWALLTFTLDFGLFMEIVYHEYDKTRSVSAVLISSMYIFYNFLYATRLLIQIQFALTALTVLDTLTTINDCFKQLLDYIRLETSSVRGPMLLKTSYNNQLNLHKKVPVKSINSIIDSLATMEVMKRMTMGVAGARAVRRLARAHAAARVIVRRLDRSHGPVMLAVMFSSLVHILISSYCVACCFVTVIHAQSFPYNPVMQAMWDVFHVSGFLIVIEPAHLTQQEMERTKILVSQMTHSRAPVRGRGRGRTARAARLGAELDLLARQLALDRRAAYAYAPMNMCPLNRKIIATVLGTITTYLVVVIQL